MTPQGSKTKKRKTNVNSFVGYEKRKLELSYFLISMYQLIERYMVGNAQGMQIIHSEVFWGLSKT
ncbi:hypothetical protein GcC1_115016 [Golovinomyces cichoracearum]|uniref:Uncharacterized protein n=1 Tax=Golovinomyces cichoracearum TaxID=62708 RepID=A0A420I7W1_9PEZI|nr:hypothetical protein GcC1_115016 [Golovinomyces cichoracearum]